MRKMREIMTQKVNQDWMTSILCRATESISTEYFLLPVAGRERPMYRERVYCYELYHQIRTRWCKDTRYSLGGEVDKDGQPAYKGTDLERTKPDFLVHVPGEMDLNKLVMEVKPISKKLKTQGITKDLWTLTAYRGGPAYYRRAILLVYGGSQDDFDRLRKRVKKIASQNTGKPIELHLIELWHHGTCGQAAKTVAW
jgi:hypothetical protein